MTDLMGFFNSILTVTPEQAEELARMEREALGLKPERIAPRVSAIQAPLIQSRCAMCTESLCVCPKALFDSEAV